MEFYRQLPPLIDILARRLVSTLFRHVLPRLNRLHSRVDAFNRCYPKWRDVQYSRELLRRNTFPLFSANARLLRLASVKSKRREGKEIYGPIFYAGKRRAHVEG